MCEPPLRDVRQISFSFVLRFNAYFFNDLAGHSRPVCKDCVQQRTNYQVCT